MMSEMMSPSGFLSFIFSKYAFSFYFAKNARSGVDSHSRKCFHLSIFALQNGHVYRFFGTSCFTLDCHLIKSIGLAFSYMAFLKVQAYSDGKIPAYVIEFGRSGEVAIIPLQDLGEEFIQNFESISVLPKKKKTAKILTISENMLVGLFNDTGVQFTADSEEYLIMSYEKFLSFAKRGIH